MSPCRWRDPDPGQLTLTSPCVSDVSLRRVTSAFSPDLPLRLRCLPAGGVTAPAQLLLPHQAARANEEEETQMQEKPFLVQSDLSVTGNVSGVYWCLANNSLSSQPAEAHHFFLVSGQPRQSGTSPSLTRGTLNAYRLALSRT